jgi:hypothetical protein
MAIRRPRNPARVGIVVAAVIIVVNLAILAALAQENGPAAPDRPEEIVMLEPEEGQLTLPQGRVGGQLRVDYTAQLVIDGRLIPKDQMSGDPNLGEFYFEPGPDKEFSQLPKGNVGAALQWWPREISTPEEAREQRRMGRYSWAFKVG